MGNGRARRREKNLNRVFKMDRHIINIIIHRIFFTCMTGGWWNVCNRSKAKWVFFSLRDKRLQVTRGLIKKKGKPDKNWGPVCCVWLLSLTNPPAKPRKIPNYFRHFIGYLVIEIFSLTTITTILYSSLLYLFKPNTSRTDNSVNICSRFVPSLFYFL